MKTLMTRLLVLFVLVCIPSSIANAQSLVSGDNNLLYDAVDSEQRPVSRLSVEDGLSQGSVNDMLQDEDGFMWFATQYGLNKYDGYSFTVFENDPDDSLSQTNNNT